jgi:hypothetical protein
MRNTHCMSWNMARKVKNREKQEMDTVEHGILQET